MIDLTLVALIVAFILSLGLLVLSVGSLIYTKEDKCIIIKDTKRRKKPTLR